MPQIPRKKDVSTLIPDKSVRLNNPTMVLASVYAQKKGMLGAGWMRVQGTCLSRGQAR